jgi:hypothetical protein
MSFISSCSFQTDPPAIPPALEEQNIDATQQKNVDDTNEHQQITCFELKKDKD